jgi:hypothetical protein
VKERESCVNEGLIEEREMCEGSGEEGPLYEDLGEGEEGKVYEGFGSEEWLRVWVKRESYIRVWVRGGKVGWGFRFGEREICESLVEEGKLYGGLGLEREVC